MYRNCVDLYTSEQKKKVAETISVANEILLHGCNENSIKEISVSLCIYDYFNKSYMNEVSVVISDSSTSNCSLKIALTFSNIIQKFPPKNILTIQINSLQ